MCKIESCSVTKLEALGLCQKHYNANYYYKNKENHNKTSARYRKENPETYRKSQRKWHIKDKYGITLESEAQMLEEQDGKCAVCDTPLEVGKWQIDHCHDTGNVRGLLCGPCNWGLGNFKDDPALLQKASEYLSGP